MNKTEKSAWNRLRVLGIVQLVAFVSIAAGLYYQPSLGDVGYLGSFGGEPLLQTYLYGGLTLIPSAVIFILAPNQKKLDQLKIARILQLILFVAVCAAFLPSAIIAQSEPLLLIACLVGIAFFPFMTSFVSALVPRAVVAVAQPVVATQTQNAAPAAGKFCDKCGSVLGAEGKCPKCA